MNKNLNDENFWNELEIEESKIKNKNRKVSNNPEDQNLLKLISSMNIEPMIEGKVLNAKYQGLTSGFHIFNYPGLKDDIYVENRPVENKYLKNTNVGETIDVIISSIDKLSFFVRGSISQLYETKAHDELINIDDSVLIYEDFLSI